MSLPLLVCLIASSTGVVTERLEADVVVVGATPGGIASAVAAARQGRTVLLVEYEDHIGGIVSNGLTNADIGKRQAVGGLFYQFTRRVVDYYKAFDRENPDAPNVRRCNDGYRYEAHVAEQIFHEMIKEQEGRIRLCLNHELKQAVVDDDRLVAVSLEDRGQPGNLVRAEGRVFVDATYEGDLAAMAGASFRTGREGRDEFQEAHAGKIYMRFGSTEPLPGSTGEADGATEAYCFRFHVTDVPENRVSIEKPSTFDRQDYRFVLDDIRSGRATRFGQIIQLIPMPNRKFELNSDHPDPKTRVPSESLDLAEDNWDWPTATPAERQRIYQRYLSHNVGLIWLLQNDPEVPAALREDARRWGWCKDEWPNHGHVPRQVYVRQGRRIEGESMLTEHDGEPKPPLGRTTVQTMSISVIEWPYDPHGCHKYDPAYPGVREGYFYVAHAPFQVPYGVIVPKKMDGLLVPVACSCSHVAYNALRMEPVFMSLGEAAGIAAHLAIEKEVEVRSVPVRQLQALLVEKGGVITFYEDLPFDHPAFAGMQWLGARALNPGYRATPEMKLTRRDGWVKLGRILAAEGKEWNPPGGVEQEKLSWPELHTWLQQAGYRPRQPGIPEDRQLTLDQFAKIVYAAMKELP